MIKRRLGCLLLAGVLLFSNVICVSAKVRTPDYDTATREKLDELDKSYRNSSWNSGGTRRYSPEEPAFLIMALGEYSDIKEGYFNYYVKEDPHTDETMIRTNYLEPGGWSSGPYSPSSRCELVAHDVDNSSKEKVYYDPKSKPSIKIYGDKIVKDVSYSIVDERYFIYQSALSAHGEKTAKKIAKLMDYNPKKPEQGVKYTFSWEDTYDYEDLEYTCQECGKNIRIYASEYSLRRPMILFEGTPVKEGVCLITLQQKIDGKTYTLAGVKIFIGPPYETKIQEHDVVCKYLILEGRDGDYYESVNNSVFSLQEAFVGTYKSSEKFTFRPLGFTEELGEGDFLGTMKLSQLVQWFDFTYEMEVFSNRGDEVKDLGTVRLHFVEDVIKPKVESTIYLEKGKTTDWEGKVHNRYNWEKDEGKSMIPIDAVGILQTVLIKPADDSVKVKKIQPTMSESRYKKLSKNGFSYFDDESIKIGGEVYYSTSIYPIFEEGEKSRKEEFEYYLVDTTAYVSDLGSDRDRINKGSLRYVGNSVVTFKDRTK